MFKFNEAVTLQLALLQVLAFLVCDTLSFRALPPNPANACATVLYARFRHRIHCYIPGMVFAAGMLLIKVKMEVNMAEAGADATAKGIRSIVSSAAGWKRAAVRGMFLLVVGLAASAYSLFVASVEVGYRYRTAGCSAAATAGWIGSWSLNGVLFMVAMALLHDQIAWVAAVSRTSSRPCVIGALQSVRWSLLVLAAAFLIHRWNLLLLLYYATVC